jgi:hypothetical protein
MSAVGHKISEIRQNNRAWAHRRDRDPSRLSTKRFHTTKTQGGLYPALSGAANTSSFPKKPVKGVDGRLGNVMLNALRVRFRGLRWNADGQENLDHEPMT